MKINNLVILFLLFISTLSYSQTKYERVVSDTLYRSQVFIPSKNDIEKVNLIYRYYILNDAIKNKNFPDKNKLNGSDEFNSLIVSWNKQNPKISIIINIKEAKDLEILIFEYRRFIK